MSRGSGPVSGLRMCDRSDRVVGARDGRGHAGHAHPWAASDRRTHPRGPADAAVVEAWADDYIHFERRPPWQEQLRDEIRSRSGQLEPSAEQGAARHVLQRQAAQRRRGEPRALQRRLVQNPRRQRDSLRARRLRAARPRWCRVPVWLPLRARAAVRRLHTLAAGPHAGVIRLDQSGRLRQ
jgi:hypothetical protein